MIRNIPSVSFVSVLRAMEDTPLFTFYLTGSRYFEPRSARRSSDIDFFVQESGVSRYLLSLGFKKLSWCGYSDSQTVAVYRHGCIDVQLVRDVHLKQKVQERIREMVPHFTEKSEKEQRTIWEMGFTFAQNTIAG